MSDHADGGDMTPEALSYCEKQTQRIATLEQQNAELVSALECAEFLFDRKWNSVVGSGCEFNWQPVGNWRHYTCKMTGETFLEAIAKVKP